MQVNGRSPGYERIRLDEALDAWISAADVRTVQLGGHSARAPQRVVGAVRVVPAAEWVDVVLAVGDRPPYQVEEKGNDLVLTLYSTQASTSLIHYVGARRGPPGPPDTLVESVTWSQETRDRARYTIHLSRAPYGYLAMWTASGFVLRVRRPPVDRSPRAAGRAYHRRRRRPPAGGIDRADRAVRAGADTGDRAASRGHAPREGRRRRDDAHHPGPGEPRRTSRHGAAVERQRDGLDSSQCAARRDESVRLATALGAISSSRNRSHSRGRSRREWCAKWGCADLGVHYDNLAVVRPTWMPAVLCEGAFIIVPEQEAALRTTAFQAAYARGVVDGLILFAHAQPRHRRAAACASAGPREPPAVRRRKRVGALAAGDRLAPLGLWWRRGRARGGIAFGGAAGRTGRPECAMGDASDHPFPDSLQPAVGGPGTAPP